MTFLHRPTVAIALATSLALAGCKKDAPASPPARSEDTAAALKPTAAVPQPSAPEPSRAAPTAAEPAPAAPKPSPPPPAPPNHETTAEESTDEDTADRAPVAAGDVKIDERRFAAMQRRAEHLHQQLDANQDGKLSPEELANATGRRARFDDPFSLDTNADGDISPDELAAGLKARAEARRAKLVGAEGESQQK